VRPSPGAEGRKWKMGGKINTLNEKRGLSALEIIQLNKTKFNKSDLFKFIISLRGGHCKYMVVQI
jgi:hypothetical protein